MADQTEKTITVQIGNSDDKLTQVGWSAYVKGVNEAITDRAYKIFFHGFSPSDAQWQNACWVFNVNHYNYLKLIGDLQQLVVDYDQDAIAWTEGNTVMLGSVPR